MPTSNTDNRDPKGYVSQTLRLNLKPEHEAEFARLIKLLQSHTGFQFVLLQFNDPLYRNMLIEKIGSAFPDTGEMKVDSIGYPTFSAFEESLMALSKKSAILHVLGLESWLFPIDSAKGMATGFNYHREVIAEGCPVPLLLWMTEPDINRFAVDAPDMWSWRAGVFRFDIEKKTEIKAQLQEGGFIPSLSLNARVKRINELVEFIGNPPDGLAKASLARLLNELGLLYLNISKNEEALRYLEEALRIQREVGDRSGEGTTLNNISQIYLVWGKKEVALKYLEASLKIRCDIGDRFGEGRALNNISQIYKAWGKSEEALNHLEASLKISREVGDRSGEGTTLNNISLIYRAYGKYEEALKYLEAALSISREVGDRSGEGATLNNIATIYYAWGKHEEALKYLEDALKISREVGDRSGEGKTLNNISLIYSAWGKYEEALNHLEDSLKIRREVGDRSGEGTTLWNIGKLLLNKGDKFSAIILLEQSLAIQREIKDGKYDKHRRFVKELKASIAPEQAKKRGASIWERS